MIEGGGIRQEIRQQDKLPIWEMEDSGSSGVLKAFQSDSFPLLLLHLSSLDVFVGIHKLI
jgi:hypothetical protein